MTNQRSASGAMSAEDSARRVDELIATDGVTFAEQAGIEMADEPGPLWQMLVLANLLSNRIRAEAALASARELWAIGCATPQGTRATSWQQRVDALGRGGYRRYDFSTATRLAQNASLVRDRWSDDLRRLYTEAATSHSEGGVGTAPHGGGVPTQPHSPNAPARAAALLQEYDGIGPAGARIFLREVQAVWPGIGAVVDPLVCKGAAKAGLPQEPGALQALAGERMPSLCAALVRLDRQR